VFLFAGKEASNLAGPFDQSVLPLGTTETVNLLRHVPENRTSPRVVTGKWLLKIKYWLLDSNIKSGPICKLKIVQWNMNSDWSDHRRNTESKNRCI